MTYVRTYECRVPVPVPVLRVLPIDPRTVLPAGDDAFSSTVLLLQPFHSG